MKKIIRLEFEEFKIRVSVKEKLIKIKKKNPFHSHQFNYELIFCHQWKICFNEYLNKHIHIHSHRKHLARCTHLWQNQPKIIKTKKCNEEKIL